MDRFYETSPLLDRGKHAPVLEICDDCRDWFELAELHLIPDPKGLKPWFVCSECKQTREEIAAAAEECLCVLVDVDQADASECPLHGGFRIAALQGDLDGGGQRQQQLGVAHLADHFDGKRAAFGLSEDHEFVAAAGVDHLPGPDQHDFNLGDIAADAVHQPECNGSQPESLLEWQLRQSIELVKLRKKAAQQVISMPQRDMPPAA